jgi:hypothetical protein
MSPKAHGYSFFENVECANRAAPRQGETRAATAANDARLGHHGFDRAGGTLDEPVP